MPIYAYKCGSCGHAKDVLQKMSDPQLTQCPACGAEAFTKQVTAAGFQLKGSGWYVTDFRGGNSGKAAPAAPATAGTTEGASASDAATAAPTASTDATKPAAAASSTAPTVASATPTPTPKA